MTETSCEKKREERREVSLEGKRARRKEEGERERKETHLDLEVEDGVLGDSGEGLGSVSEGGTAATKGRKGESD